MARIALLAPWPAVSQWFAKHYPEVICSSYVTADLLLADVILITSLYEVEGHSYQVLNIWREYLNGTDEEKKLVVVGWLDRRENNYFYLGQPPQNLEAWIGQEVQDFWGEPEFPDLPDEDLLPLIEKRLLSHGLNTLQGMAIELAQVLQGLETLRDEGAGWFGLKSTPQFEEAIQCFKSWQHIWVKSEPFFALLPFYPELKTFRQVEEALAGFFEEGKGWGEDFSSLVSQFIKKNIRKVTKFYDLDKRPQIPRK
ncbi:MAG: hypothetical protein AAFR61_11090 [Bacteroidota bacterium]